VTLRAKLSLVLSALLVMSIGLTGGILIYESAASTRDHLTREHQLLAENRAFALRDNLAILEGELERLALRPQIDLSDEDFAPEAQLLQDAHHDSVLYNTAVLLLSREGACVGAVPDQSAWKSRHFGDLPWFQAVSTGGSDVVFQLSEDATFGRTLTIIQPIVRRRKFVGALLGVIALDHANIIVPALRENLPPATEAVLIDGRGGVVVAAGESSAPATDFVHAVQSSTTAESGVWNGVHAGERSLFAYAKVKAHSDFIVVFRRPWSVLVAHLRQQAWALAVVLLFGVLLASMAGLWLSAFLTRPLELLRASALRIATGQHGPAGELRLVAGGDELGVLVHDFLEMERAIQERDRALREAKSSLEQRVFERTAELEVAQHALVEAERFAAMGKTSAAIAHELKNALNGLGMAVELIIEDPANPRVGRLRTQVLYEIDRLRDVVDSLSSFSHTPRIRLRVENLTPVVARAVEVLADLIADRDAEVRVAMPDRFLLSCDGHKVQGVIMNLVKNAVEAARVVEIRARFEGDHAIIEVDDDGPGMSSEATRHLFEPFFTTKPNGTGLGLATSLRYVRAHGGNLAVDAAALGGARVVVSLPREPLGTA